MGLFDEQVRRLIKRESKLDTRKFSHRVDKKPVASTADLVFRPFRVGHMLKLVKEYRQ